MKLLCQEIDPKLLTTQELNYLSQFVDKDLDLQTIWQLMDQAWEECGAGYTEAQIKAVDVFYEHPVWLLNGIFTECDPASQQHREGIAEWIAESEPNLVADFGGGYGSLVRKIANYSPNTKVQIVEPYPSKLATHLARPYPNIEYVSKLPNNADVVIAQDVLEHLPDPLSIFSKLLEAAKIDGYILTANCFRPVIKCHLPETFHFRYSFQLIAPNLGCNYIGKLPKVPHVEIYRKTAHDSNWSKARTLESLSRLAFPILEITKPIFKPLLKLKRKLNQK